MHTANELYGETYGIEAAVTLEVMPWWRLHPSYTFIDMQLHKRSASLDLNSERDEGKTPQHQATLRSSMDLPGGLSLDCLVRYVDELPALGISSYVELDLCLTWRATRNLQLTVVGQNLLDKQHPEFSPSFIATRQTEIERGVYGKITWRF
jgi:iron complex outermembrane receptor protein